MKKLKLSKKVKKVLLWTGLVLGGIIIVGGASFGVVKANDYWQVKQLVKVSDDLVKQEKYQEAYDKLNIAQARWTTAKVKSDIATKMNLDKQLIADQSSYNIANDLFGQLKWQEAKDSYSKVSDKFIHYPEAQAKVEACQAKIDAANALAQQQAAQQTAQAAQQKQKAVASDPYPTPEDYSSCPQYSGSGMPPYDVYKCEFDINAKNHAAVLAWDARHGITPPQTTKPVNTNCHWVGNDWSCTTQ